MTEKRSILFRCDSSGQIGMGHLTRCLALAEILKSDGYDVIFICKPLVGNGVQTILSKGFKVHLLKPSKRYESSDEIIDLAKKKGASKIIVDLSHRQILSKATIFISFLESLTRAGLLVNVFEGMNEECLSLRVALPVSSIIVPYFGADKCEFKTQKNSRVLAGEKYFPLRSEIVQLGGVSKQALSRANRILVSLGGGKNKNFNDQVVKALSLIDHKALEIVIIGKLSRGIDSCKSFEVVTYTQDIQNLYRWADCAIIGSGLTRYETAYLGTPSLVFSLNESHERMVNDFVASGAAFGGGVFSKTSPEKMASIIQNVIGDKPLRQRMADRGPKIIDGHGATRVANELASLSGC